MCGVFNFNNNLERTKYKFNNYHNGFVLQFVFLCLYVSITIDFVLILLLLLREKIKCTTD